MTKIYSRNLTASAVLAQLLTNEGHTAIWWSHGRTGCVVTYAPVAVVNSCIALVNMGAR